MRYVCSICNYVYDEADNIPWAELPEDWKCPLCGAAKSDFVPEGGVQPDAVSPSAVTGEIPVTTDMKALTAMETSAICSNLAKGCEKQYMDKQAAAFRELASWFKSQAGEAPQPSFGQLLDLVNADLSANYPAADAVSRQNGDRGALRSLTWSEKVTRILKSLLTRYEKEGDAMLENTGVYVCTICGFVYVGDDLPELCPVCKVPNKKFEKMGG